LVIESTFFADALGVQQTLAFVVATRKRKAIGGSTAIVAGEARLILQTGVATHTRSAPKESSPAAKVTESNDLQRPAASLAGLRDHRCSGDCRGWRKTLRRKMLRKTIVANNY
jgi:hypothetical protein